MPWIIPDKSGGGRMMFSNYRTMEKSGFFELQEKKVSKFKKRLPKKLKDNRPAYRIIARYTSDQGLHPLKIAYSNNLHELKKNEWQFCAEDFGNVAPKNLNAVSLWKWMEAFFTNLAILKGAEVGEDENDRAKEPLSKEDLTKDMEKEKETKPEGTLGFVPILSPEVVGGKQLEDRDSIGTNPALSPYPDMPHHEKKFSFSASKVMKNLRSVFKKDKKRHESRSTSPTKATLGSERRRNSTGDLTHLASKIAEESENVPVVEPSGQKSPRRERKNSGKMSRAPSSPTMRRITAYRSIWKDQPLQITNPYRPHSPGGFSDFEASDSHSGSEGNFAVTAIRSNSNATGDGFGYGWNQAGEPGQVQGGIGLTKTANATTASPSTPTFLPMQTARTPKSAAFRRPNTPKIQSLRGVRYARRRENMECTQKPAEDGDILIPFSGVPVFIILSFTLAAVMWITHEVSNLGLFFCLGISLVTLFRLIVLKKPCTLKISLTVHNSLKSI
ncbi:hypothetical protein AAMO2058_001324500 [Amorphochlora amoebiformis]